VEANKRVADDFGRSYRAFVGFFCWLRLVMRALVEGENSCEFLRMIETGTGSVGRLMELMLVSRK
jgi:hypothetical protein